MENLPLGGIVMQQQLRVPTLKYRIPIMALIKSSTHQSHQQTHTLPNSVSCTDLFFTDKSNLTAAEADLGLLQHPRWSAL